MKREEILDGLRQSPKVDVCVIGGGISGITTAYLLAKAGKQVALLDDGPVRHAAAAVVSAQGVLAARGPTDMVFRLASVTKLLTAYACLIAVE